MRSPRLYLATILAAAALATSLASSCADPYPRADGQAELVSCYDEPGGAQVVVRITCRGPVSASSFGCTVRLDTSVRRYWASMQEQSLLPPGAATTRSFALAFSSADESLEAGSAAVDSFWMD